MKINNIDTYTDLELALMVLLDYLGRGDARKKKLGNRFKSVQNLVNYILANKEVPAGTGHMSIELLNDALLEMEPSHKDYLEYVADIIENVKRRAR